RVMEDQGLPRCGRHTHGRTCHPAACGCGHSHRRASRLPIGRINSTTFSVRLAHPYCGQLLFNHLTTARSLLTANLLATIARYMQITMTGYARHWQFPKLMRGIPMPTEASRLVDKLAGGALIFL